MLCSLRMVISDLVTIDFSGKTPSVHARDIASFLFRVYDLHEETFLFFVLLFQSLHSATCRLGVKESLAARLACAGVYKLLQDWPRLI
jgi:hypothetical protein